ncbi:MAG TPA: 5-methyltetrahydropteroyltriglutamate--homocysteine S-methyltransferase [Alphaproteobacteria bacterium]|nr:5-methyltetrahydropteroyltriglutamate--homocysteine S-methyltransferase [Alphaproteobacteria bacterium]
MTASGQPPFRAEHVGSLLRPKELTQAFRAFHKGEMPEADFHRVQDQAITDVVALQEDLGLELVTDGEFRRASYWSHWVDAIDGLEVGDAVFRFSDAEGNELPFTAAVCTGKLRKAKPISTEEFKYLQSVAHATPKITMPSPSTLHFYGLHRTVENSPYQSDAAFLDDLCAIFAQEIADLHALGCRYVQIDEVPLIMLGNPNIRERTTELGYDPEAVIDLYIKAMNDAAGGRPEGMVAGMHMCRGNFKGRWLTTGGYDEIAEKVFGEVDVDAFFLEYDTERAGSFEPLKHVPKGKKVVLGIVSSKVATLEDADRLKARIADAAKYVPLENLSISPQCGFASTVAGNPVDIGVEKAKLGLLVDVARDVWG